MFAAAFSQAEGNSSASSNLLRGLLCFRLGCQHRALSLAVFSNPPPRFSPFMPPRVAVPSPKHWRCSRQLRVSSRRSRNLIPPTPKNPRVCFPAKAPGALLFKVVMQARGGSHGGAGGLGCAQTPACLYSSNYKAKAITKPCRLQGRTPPPSFLQIACSSLGGCCSSQIGYCVCVSEKRSPLASTALTLLAWSGTGATTSSLPDTVIMPAGDAALFAYSCCH